MNRKRLREWVYTFQPRFVSRVRDGRKLRTMRPKRKDGKRPSPGEGISLRRWEGSPYRSFQEVIRRSTITAVSDVVIEQGKMPVVAGRRLTAAEAVEFAQYDGFEDYADMLEWFDHQHGQRIELDMIEWKPEPAYRACAQCGNLMPEARQTGYCVNCEATARAEEDEPAKTLLCRKGGR